MPAFHDLLFLTTSVAPFLWVEELVQLAWSTTEVRAAILPFANRAAFNREVHQVADRLEEELEALEAALNAADSSDSCDDADTQSSDFYRSGFTPTP